MKRRTFLKLSVAAGIFPSLAFSSRLFAGTPPEKSSSLRLGSLPLLFVDDSGVEHAEVTAVYHPAQTRAEPVIVADRPWEKGRVYVYGSAFYDAASKQFRLWYCTPKPSSVLQAVSTDGLKWEKPSLGLCAVNGSKDNNIVLADVHSPSLLFDERETDPARRYKLIGARKPVGYVAYFSPDGTNWTEGPHNPVTKGDDTLTIAQHPVTGEYLLYHKKQILLRGSLRRTVWLSRSKDFQKWSKAELVFAADEIDDAWAKDGQRTDVYDMAVFPHAGGFFGLPAMFRVERVTPKASLGEGQSGDDGPITIQLATSMDGQRWERPAERIAMIPLGADGAFDQGAMMGVTNQMIDHGDETWLYYTGLTTTHGAPIPPKQISIGRAEWRLHGLASMDASAQARLETRLLRFENAQLCINADASKGSLRAGLLDDAGKPLPGFALEDCVPLKENATRWIPTWKGGATVPTDRDVRVVLEMSDSSLFSLSAPAKSA